MEIDRHKLELETRKLAFEVIEEVNNRPSTMFSIQDYTDRFLHWAMRDEELKVSLFRFVDVLPSLPDSNSIVRHVREYFEPLQQRAPTILRKALALSSSCITAKLTAPVIKKQIRFVGERFITGESPEKAAKALRNIRKRGMAFTVDLVGESVVSEKEAQTYLERYLKLIEHLSRSVKSWKEVRALIPGHRAEKTPINISVKLSALYSQAKALAFDDTVEILSQRLSKIMRAAKSHGAFINVDMEDSSLVDVTLETFKRVLEQEEFKSYDRCGIALQAYLRRTRNDLEELIAWARKRNSPIAVRLVKGAYWDTETILSQQRNWPVPVWQIKSNSDAAYESLSELLLINHRYILPAFASHNVRSLCAAIKLAEQLGVPPTDFELQTLYGMGDPIKKAFSSRGYLVREYAPVGELIPAMGYLVRRLLENTANEGFLRASFFEKSDINRLLDKPVFNDNDSGEREQRSTRLAFNNSPLTDFSIPENRLRISVALSSLQNELKRAAKTVRPIIEGRAVDSMAHTASLCPEDPTLVVAQVKLADTESADRAVRSLLSYFPTWRDTTVKQRADILFNTAQVIDKKRDKLSAAIILETGKAWSEADADVAEAVDFLNYYALEAERLFRPREMSNLLGETNSYFYEPRGVVLVISPWNFPLAIPCGMLSAALVTGNCAVLKPAGQSSYVASLLFEALLEGGLPPEAAAFIPSKGSEVGPFLAKHSGISTIVFTGSKEVGLSLIEASAQHHPHAEHMTRVIAEMGGKNAIIVDDDADLDEAVKGVVYSAFGYSGQKCSACSRVYIVGGQYERFVERLRESVRSIYVGPASDPKTLVGPVIDSHAKSEISAIIARAKSDCTIIAEGTLQRGAKKEAYYVPPIVFSDIPSGHEILVHEIFGPVLALIRAENFDHALDLALESEYGLTGGVFSRSPENLKKAAREFRVGNLYLNRGCTGAMVMRQPFGGAKMSGVGSKAGGPDYLLQFVIPRTITENTMRRGFAPLQL